MSRRRSARRLVSIVLTLGALLAAYLIDGSLPVGLESAFVPSGVATSSGRVAKVVDGDTVDIDTGGKRVRVRLIGIDSPESVDPRRPVQCFGKEASLHARSALLGEQVTLEYDASQGRTDKYGRTLAYVVRGDGTNFNERMIADGYAYEYTYRYPYRYQVAFKDAERTARKEGRGLWASATCSGER
jgi:micrococcal nuclease